MTLNTDLGWSLGDDIRVLVALGLGVSIYHIKQIQSDMNYIGTEAPSVITPIKGLLDQYDSAQTSLKSLNNDSEGRMLKKADVLEWEANAPGASYGPERELQRIKQLLIQYFSFSILAPNISNVTANLIRS